MNRLSIRQSLRALALAAAAIAIGADAVFSGDAESNHAGFDPPPVLALAAQPAARLVVDMPQPEALAKGYVVLRYRAENLRIMPVYGPDAVNILPRIGHLHVTLDDLPWHWLDASGEPLSINGLPPGRHKLLIELEDATHKVLDRQTVSFEIPPKAQRAR